MNLVIVTCPQLATDRLSRQVAQINSAIAAGFITGLQIICMDDSKARRLVSTCYRPEKWASDITIGWELFRHNIIAQSQNFDSSEDSHLDALTSDVCFPPRLLTPSEHSIALRHILAIEAIAHANSPCIVLEDDALVCDELLFLDLVQGFCNYSRTRLFYDLSDGYIPIGMARSKPIQIGRLQYCVRPTAITRTLMAYAMFPETAGLLLNALCYYSLPIDMQLQVLLCRHCIPGLSLINSPFMHGSKNGATPSSVRQSL